MSPFGISGEAVFASLITVLLTSPKEKCHNASRVEDIVVRECRVLNELEPVCHLHLGVRCWFDLNSLNSNFLSGSILYRIVNRN